MVESEEVLRRFGTDWKKECRRKEEESLTIPCLTLPGGVSVRETADSEGKRRKA